MTIDRYLARTILAGFLTVLLVLMSLTLMFTFVTELKRFSDHDFGTLLAFGYALAQLPQLAYVMFPIAVFLGALLGLGNLAANTELVVLRAAGMSLPRLARPVLLTAGLLGVAGFLNSDWLVPFASEKAQQFKQQTRSDSVGAQVEKSVWFKDGARIIHVEQLDAAAQVRGLSAFEFAENGTLLRVERAESATHQQQQWQLRNVQETAFEGEKSAVAKAVRRAWRTTLTPEQMSHFVASPMVFSSYELYQHLNYLKENQLETSDYERVFWERLATPISIVLMGLLALPFVFGPLRSAGAGQRVLVGALLGLSYFVVNQVVGHSGQVYGLSPLVAAFLPTVLLAIVVFFAMRWAR